VILDSSALIAIVLREPGYEEPVGGDDTHVVSVDVGSEKHMQ
jgi:PIN domain nuclease of toxin-antitoxin system